MNIDEIKESLLGLSDDELHDVVLASKLLEQDRKTIAFAEEQADNISRQFSRAVGRSDDDQWIPPNGAYDAYPKAAVVTHNGKRWVNLSPANVWEPGVSGWREEVPSDAAPPEYVQPTGAHDAYSVGDSMTWSGGTYRSLIDGNVWDPNSNPSGWTQVEPLVPPVGIDEPVEEVHEWTQPTGGHDSYSIGDQVLWEGDVYESTIDGNSWSPSSYPAGWKKI